MSSRTHTHRHTPYTLMHIYTSPIEITRESLELFLINLSETHILSKEEGLKCLVYVLLKRARA